MAHSVGKAFILQVCGHQFESAEPTESWMSQLSPQCSCGKMGAETGQSPEACRPASLAGVSSEQETVPMKDEACWYSRFSSDPHMCTGLLKML